MGNQDLLINDILHKLPIQLVPDYPLDFLAELRAVKKYSKTQYDIYFFVEKEKFLLTLIRKTEVCKHVADLSFHVKFEITEFHCFIYKENMGNAKFKQPCLIPLKAVDGSTLGSGYENKHIV